MRHGSFNLSLGGSDIFYLVKLELFHFPGNKKKKKKIEQLIKEQKGYVLVQF
jgi:hypothetical protein